MHPDLLARYVMEGGPCNVVSSSACLLLLCCCLPQSLGTTRAEAVSAPDSLTPPWTPMRAALHEALHWRLAAASEMALHLEQQPPHAFEAQLVRGIIAYFQTRWQIPLPSPSRQADHKVLSTLIETGQRQLARSPRKARLQLILGTAAIFHALLQQQRGASLDFALLAQARTWLQQALMAHESMPDAHLGLGLVYFAGSDSRPYYHAWRAGGARDATEAIYHLQRAAESGHFSAEVAQTFLIRVYELAKRYEEAITLGQALQARFPSNGYYALLIGRSQYAEGQYAPCATTLGQLAALSRPRSSPPCRVMTALRCIISGAGPCTRRRTTPRPLMPCGRPLTRILDTKDASLWAKYYLGILYERRGATKRPGNSTRPCCAGGTSRICTSRWRNGSLSCRKGEAYGVSARREWRYDGVMDSSRVAHRGERLPCPGSALSLDG